MQKKITNKSAQKSRRIPRPHNRSVVLSLLAVVFVLTSALVGYFVFAGKTQTADTLLGNALVGTVDAYNSPEIDKKAQKILLIVRPDDTSSKFSLSAELDGQVNSQSDKQLYSGSGMINASILGQNIAFPIQFISSESDGNFIKMTNLDKVIEQLESDVPVFKLYSSYAKDVAKKYNDAWVKINLRDIQPDSDQNTCNILRDDVVLSDVTKNVVDTSYQQNPFFADASKLDIEDVLSRPSQRISTSIDSALLQRFVKDVVGDSVVSHDDQCKSKYKESVTKNSRVNLWVDTQNSVFTKITTTYMSNKVSLALVEVPRDSRQKQPTIPTEFTTVAELKKSLEQIIGSFQ